MAGDEKVYTAADVDRIVAERVAERERGIVVAELRTELNAIRKEIGSANHLKRTFGKQLAELNALVRSHVSLPMHPGTAEKFTEIEDTGERVMEEFGLDKLTPEERAAFPNVVKSVLAGQKRVIDRKTAENDRAEADSRFWQKVAAGAAAAAVVMSALSASGAFTWVRIALFHLKS